MRVSFFVLIVWFGYFLSSALAQQSVAPPGGANTLPTHADDHIPSTGNRRVWLDVVVADKSGTTVPRLQQQDFTLLDDKQPQKIVSFQAVDASDHNPDSAVQAIFVIDAVNASYMAVSLERQALDKIFRQNGGQFPIPASFVVLTDKTPQLNLPPKRDGNALAAALDTSPIGIRTIGRSQGFYGAVERVQISLQALKQITNYARTQPGRKLLIWLSPGWPLLSGPHVEITDRDQTILFGTVVAISTEMRQARITLYSIDPIGVADAVSPRTFYYENFLKGVTSPRKVENGNLALQVIAEQTGGLVLNSTNDVAKSIGTCVAQARPFYTLSFDSAPADGPNEYHNLQVKVDRSALTARARTGYYDQP